MNKLLIFLVFAFVSCSLPLAQRLTTTNYNTTRDEGHEDNSKILRGVINRSIIEADTAFKWFADNMKYANVDANAIKVFEKNKEKFSLLVFGGTWCSDTKVLLSQFYKLIDKSGFPNNKIYLIGVDRAKTTINNLHTTYNILNVPTFIVLHNNVEIGRVVEYGKTGAIDKELADIVSKIE